MLTYVQISYTAVYRTPVLYKTYIWLYWVYLVIYAGLLEHKATPSLSVQTTGSKVSATSSDTVG